MVKRPKTKKTKTKLPPPDPKKSGLLALMDGQRERDEEEELPVSAYWDGPFPMPTAEQIAAARLRARSVGLVRSAARRSISYDQNDKKTARYAVRLHPDLFAEASKIARDRGQRLATIIERALVELVNNHHKFELVDAIGRYIGDPRR